MAFGWEAFTQELSRGTNRISDLFATAALGNYQRQKEQEVWQQRHDIERKEKEDFAKEAYERQKELTLYASNLQRDNAINMEKFQAGVKNLANSPGLVAMNASHKLLGRADLVSQTEDVLNAIYSGTPIDRLSPEQQKHFSTFPSDAQANLSQLSQENTRTRLQNEYTTVQTEYMRALIEKLKEGGKEGAFMSFFGGDPGDLAKAYEANVKSISDLSNELTTLTNSEAYQMSANEITRAGGNIAIPLEAQPGLIEKLSPEVVQSWQEMYRNQLNKEGFLRNLRWIGQTYEAMLAGVGFGPPPQGPEVPAVEPEPEGAPEKAKKNILKKIGGAAEDVFGFVKDTGNRVGMGAQNFLQHDSEQEIIKEYSLPPQARVIKLHGKSDLEDIVNNPANEGAYIYDVSGYGAFEPKVLGIFRNPIFGNEPMLIEIEKKKKKKKKNAS